MKRSEVIDIISNFLDDHVQQDVGYAWKYSKQSADTLLSQLEDIGMKPPGRWSSVLRGDTAKGRWKE